MRKRILAAAPKESNPITLHHTPGFASLASNLPPSLSTSELRTISFVSSSFQRYKPLGVNHHEVFPRSPSSYRCFGNKPTVQTVSLAIQYSALVE